MAEIDKSLPNEVRSKVEIPSEEINVEEVVEQKPPVEVIPEDDGGVTLDFEPGSINIPGTENHFDNLADILPEDILEGDTGVACIDGFISELLKTGYVHNHARMYIASYIVHFRGIKWQVGARWFLSHLLDGDIASNNFSWQWIASTFSNKPYIFNLENVHKYFNGIVNTTPSKNSVLNASYQTLQKRLFPNLEIQDG